MPAMRWVYRDVVHLHLVGYELINCKADDLFFDLCNIDVLSLCLER